MGIAVILFTGCVGPQYHKDLKESQTFNESIFKKPIKDQVIFSSLSELGASEIDTLLSQLHQQNLTVQISWEKLRQAELGAWQAGARLLPTVHSSGSFMKTKSANKNPVSGNSQIQRNEMFQWNLRANWEIDLFGRLLALRKAAVYSVQSMEALTRNSLLMMEVNAINAWLQMIQDKQSLSVLGNQMKLSEKFVSLMEMRQGQGLATSLDVNQQRQQTEAMRGNLALLKSQSNASQRNLLYLLNKDLYASAIIPDSMPVLRGVERALSDSVTLKWIQQRPDVAMAWFQLRAADEMAASAILSFFPTISLSLDIFQQAESITDWAGDILYQALAAANLPLFTGGNKVFETKKQNSAAREAYLNYQLTLSNALKEILDARDQCKQMNLYLKSIQKQTQYARTNFELARLRYSQGATDFLRVLNAEQSLNNLQRSLIKAKKDAFMSYVLWLQSIGGAK